ncbi:MAG: hypothetical protein ACXQS7_06360 [Candidatus Syntropharchaeia archaeon]
MYPLQDLILLTLAFITICLATGVLLTKDNLFSALYMSATLILVASIYAFFGIQPGVLFIVFIFTGAIGAVTVALAATYRAEPESPSYGYITAIVLVTALAILGSFTSMRSSPGDIEFTLSGFIQDPSYILLIVALSSLGILLMLAALRLIGGVSEWR